MVNEFSYLSTGYSTYGREILTRFHNSEKYEVAEFATYIDHEDSRVKDIPWTVFCNLPVSPNSPNHNKEEVDRYNSNPINAFGAWRFEDVCLNYKPDIVCTPPGSLVLTSNGYKKIETINIGEKVFTHKGRIQKVTKTFKKQYNGKLYSISFSGCSEPLILTPEHPVLVYKKRSQTNQKKSISKIYEGVEPEFIAVKDLKRKDLILLPNKKKLTDSNKIDITEYLDQYIEDNEII